MKYVKTIFASVLVAGAALAQAEIQWLQPAPNDLRASALEANARSVPASMHHESASINFAWGPEQFTDARRPAAGPTDTLVSGATTESRQYWLDATGAELARGLDLPISAPGAVIRISALESGSGISLDAERLELHMNGRAISGQFGPEQISTGSDMRDQGMRVPEDSLAFRLQDGFGAGTLQVSMGGIPADQALVIHVHEPNSDWVARLSLPRHNFLSGQALDFNFSLGNGRQTINPRSVQAVLVSPDGSQTWPLQAGRDSQPHLAAAPIASRSQLGQGLYEAHVYVEGEFNGQIIRRDLTLALNIAPAVARFNGQAAKSRSEGLGINLGVETATAGRFQVNAELMGTNARGQLEPVAFIQSAAVLGVGRGTINLDIEPGLLKQSGLNAPFEIHNLQLLDQGRMYLLEHRERAMLIR
jgi:hypothetical protein